MKKVVLALAAIATVVCFTSCDKTCVCKSTVNGVSVETEVELNKDHYKKCSDMNTVVAGITIYECK